MPISQRRQCLEDPINISTDRASSVSVAEDPKQIEPELEDRTCSICLEALDQYTIFLACGTEHPFHSKCLGQWMFDEEHHTCPNCVRVIDAEERRAIFDAVSALDVQKIKDTYPICCLPWRRKRR